MTVEFVAVEVQLNRLFSEKFSFPLPTTILPMLHAHLLQTEKFDRPEQPAQNHNLSIQFGLKRIQKRISLHRR
jgi:hypothetical protein